MSDDRTIFYHDARAEQGLLTSAADKQRKALKHFDCFLENYSVQIGVNVVESSDIPYDGLPPKTSSKDIFEFWDRMIGAFITYMGQHAKSGCNPRGNPLSQNTAEGYCSSVKVYFTTKFRHEHSIPVFQPEQWRILRDKLKSCYRESTRGKQLTEGKASSTRQDREAMATACIWLGTPEYAEFWHLLNASFHCSGRGSEVSLITTKGIKATEVNELDYNYQILSVDIQRQKNGPHQTLPIYPDRDGVLEDFYFSLIHLIVMKGCNHDYIFPNFSKAALKKTQGKSDSAVSKEWTKLFDELHSSFEVLADEINEELSSRSNRKGSNQTMAECPSLGGYAQIYRTGWTSNSIHSVFDYINGSFIMTAQAGKAVAKWTTKSCDTIVGGQPPTFDDIETDVDTLKEFTSVLFEDDIKGNWNPKVRELLVMTLLLRYKEFSEVLESHPFATKVVEENPNQVPSSQQSNESFEPTCSTVSNNPFICRIVQATERVSAEKSFLIWVKEARQAFLQRNMPAIPIKNFSLYSGSPFDGKEMLMDPRCFVDHFNIMATTVQSLHMKVLRQGHVINSIQHGQVADKNTLKFMVEEMYNTGQIVRRLETNLIGAVTTPAPVTPQKKRPLRFSTSSKTLSKNASLTETTTAFFADDYKAGYELDTKSLEYKEMDAPEKKSLRNKFSSIKRAVRAVMMYADSYPQESEDEAPSHYKEKVRRIASAAEERIRDDFEEFKDKKDKIITIYKLEKVLKRQEIKELERTWTLPEDAPEEARKFFKSA